MGPGPGAGAILGGAARELVATSWGGFFFRLAGREVFLAFWYRPQALQMVEPCGDLLQRGVCVVPQLLDTIQHLAVVPQIQSSRSPADLANLTLGTAGSGSRAGAGSSPDLTRRNTALLGTGTGSL